MWELLRFSGYYTAVLILLKTASVGTHTDSRVDLVFSRKTWSVGTHTILP
ncbi:hypothetical protein [Leptospira sanjuanensis]|nr:hypothetical protein [Leptospira sanjuanensis]MCG6168429.1 hypothetical protein [Leptospira sanjuanensis]